MSNEKNADRTQPELNERREKLRGMAREALDAATRPGDRVEILSGQLTGTIGVVTECHSIDNGPVGVTVHVYSIPDPDERDLFYSHGEYRRVEQHT